MAADGGDGCYTEPMNKNEKRAELRSLLTEIQEGKAGMEDVKVVAAFWVIEGTEMDDLVFSMNYIMRLFEDGQQGAIRGIHWLMDWVDNQNPFM